MDPILTLAARSTELLCAFSLCLQTVEFFWLREPLSERGIWAFSVQKGDLAHASSWVQQLFAILSKDSVHILHLCLRLIAVLCLGVYGASLWLVLFLFLGNVAILIRWRCAFNGGSDFMTMVVLTGLLIATILGAFNKQELGWRAGLIYIAIHVTSSYFIAGWVKVLNQDWRQGKALALFLDGGVFGPLANNSLYWRRWVALLCTWSFILWECVVPIVFLDPRLAAGYCAIGVIFHFLVFWYFGLNRFVFAWMATYPAVIYLAVALA